MASSSANYSEALASCSSSWFVPGGWDATSRFIMTKYNKRIPEDYIRLTPDIILYTWVCCYDAPLPAGRTGESVNYVVKLRTQAKDMSDHVHVLLYSRWRMTNEAEMLDQLRCPQLVVLCLEDIPDVIPPRYYNWVVRSYDSYTFMHFVRQVALWEAPDLKNLVRTKCSPKQLEALTGNAIIAVDMDMVFLHPPKEWITPTGMMAYMECEDADARSRVNDRTIEDVSTSLLGQFLRHGESINAMIIVGYEYADNLSVGDTLRPSVVADLVFGGIADRITVYQQTVCLRRLPHHFGAGRELVGPNSDNAYSSSSSDGGSSRFVSVEDRIGVNEPTVNTGYLLASQIEM